MIRVYHGGHLNEHDTRLWATRDFDYAAAFAQLHESAVWMLTLDVDDGQVLDLTGCGLDVAAVATDLLLAGIPASVQPDDERHPQEVLRRASPDRSGLPVIVWSGSKSGSIGVLASATRSRC